ncbi:hypothetical protein M514_06407, partial [Trichuris suis]
MDPKSLPFAWLIALSQANKEEVLARIKTELRQIPGGPGDETAVGQCRSGDQLPKCRYTNIPCLEATRVLLRHMPPDQDFTHANFVRFAKAPCVFIAAMAPENDSIGNFWTIVWNEKVDTIVCLTDLVEKGKTKTAKYWPEYDEEFEIEDLRVRLEEAHKMDGFRSNILNVRQMRSREMRFIEHIIYKDWPDHGGPNCTHIVLSIIERLIHTSPRCTLVHCSAGIGRTGTFIALVMLVTQVNAGEAPDIAAAVKTVRSMRPWAVQACIQYMFLYWAAVVYILQKVDIPNTEKMVLHEKLAYLKNATSGSLCTIPLRPGASATAERSRQKGKKKKVEKTSLMKAGEFIDKSLRTNACRLRNKFLSPKRSLSPMTPNMQPATSGPAKVSGVLDRKEVAKKLTCNEKDKEEVHHAVPEKSPESSSKERLQEAVNVAVLEKLPGAHKKVDGAIPETGIQQPVEKTQEGANEVVAKKLPSPSKKGDGASPEKQPESGNQQPVERLQEGPNEAVAKNLPSSNKKPIDPTQGKQPDAGNQQPAEQPSQEGANEAVMKKPPSPNKKPNDANPGKLPETVNQQPAEQPQEGANEAAMEKLPNPNKKGACQQDKTTPPQGDPQGR